MMESPSHTHCKGCGLHFRSVAKMIPISKTEGTWTCSVCIAQTTTAQQGNMVLIPCPDCANHADPMLQCGGCEGLGSVYVPQARIKLYVPQAERIDDVVVLTEG
jgi:hypothetical protein